MFDLKAYIEKLKQIQEKEFLSVPAMAKLIGMSTTTLYFLFEHGDVRPMLRATQKKIQMFADKYEHAT